MTRYLFDTNVLVAAVLAEHPHHARAVPWLQRAVRGEIALFVSQHSLAECWSALTVVPIARPISGELASRVIEHDIIGAAHASVVPLDRDDYAAALSAASLRGLRGGAIYDALIARAAKRADAIAVTFNLRHFSRLIDDAARLVSP